MLTQIFFSFLLFMFGGCAASFGSCVGYRIARKMNWVTGRSVCNHCGKQLKAWELIPVFSCLVLNAHCSKCHAYFGWRNCISEAILGCFCVVLTLPIGDLQIRMIRVCVISCIGIFVLVLYEILLYQLKKF